MASRQPERNASVPTSNTFTTLEFVSDLSQPGAMDNLARNLKGGNPYFRDRQATPQEKKAAMSVKIEVMICVAPAPPAEFKTASERILVQPPHDTYSRDVTATIKRLAEALRAEHFSTVCNKHMKMQVRISGTFRIIN